MAKKTFRRRLADHSVAIRRAVQLGFLALNVWIGYEFYLWVRHHETGGATPWVQRPPGVEGWLPIASLMNLKYWAMTGRVPEIHPAGTFLLAAFLITSLLLRKAFCGWLCPVGTVSEGLWRLGRRLLRRNFALPRWADLPLRSIKYILLGLFLWAIGGMSADAIRFFLDGPYGIVADVKLLDFFRHMGGVGLGVTAFIVVASIFVQNFWCRYLCPYGALMGLFSWQSPLRIRRVPELCIDCAKCAKACPSQLKVDKLIQIESPECLGCYECVASCPADGALAMTVAGRRTVPAWASGLAVVTIFLLFAGGAQYFGFWHTVMPTSVYMELVPQAGEFSHP